MQLEKGKISGPQLAFLIAGFMQGSIFVTTYTFSNTPRDEWLMVLIAFAVTLPFLLMYIKLSAMYAGKTLIGINDKVLGPIFGKIFSVIYCLYLILASAGNFRFPSGFLHSIFMLETPTIVFAFVLILFSAIAIYGGIETISRLGLFTTITVLLCMVFYFILLLNKMDFKRFLPIMDVPPPKALQSVIIIGTQYFGEVFIISMVLPNVADGANLKKNYLAGAALGMATILIIAVIVTSVLGNVAAISTGPLIETTRHIEVLGILLRTEFLFMSFLIFTAFYKSCIFYYITLIAVAEFLKLRSYRVLVIPLGLLIFSLVQTSAENSVSMAAAGRNGWVFLSMLIIFVLPLITFIAAVIKTLPKKGGE